MYQVLRVQKQTNLTRSLSSWNWYSSKETQVKIVQTTNQCDFQTVINVMKKIESSYGIGRDLVGNYGSRGQRGGNIWYVNYRVRSSRYMRPQSVTTANTRKQMRVQSDSDHNQRKHRVQMSVWKRHLTSSSWLSVSSDGYSTACTWLRGGAARYCRQEAQPMGFREFSLRNNTRAIVGQGYLACPGNRDSLESWQRYWNWMQMVNIPLSYSPHPKPHHHFCQLYRIPIKARGDSRSLPEKNS